MTLAHTTFEINKDERVPQNPAVNDLPICASLFADRINRFIELRKTATKKVNVFFDTNGNSTKLKCKAFEMSAKITKN